MPETGAFEHGGNLYAAARRAGTAPADFLDFSANMSPLGLPASAQAAILAALPLTIHYPDAEAAALKDAISRRYAIAPDLITCGNGAAELLYILCYRRRPRRVLVPAPTFSEYERAARAAGAAVDYFPLAADDGFRLDPEPFCRRLAGVDITFLCSPNNPTGQPIDRPAAERIVAAAARHGGLVVIDESFLDFLPDAADYTCRPLLAAYPNLVILKSLTKFYAIPGLRLGFALAQAPIGRLLAAGKDPWNVNSLAQAAGAAALADEEYRLASIAATATARAELAAALAALPGVAPLPATANFILVDIAGTGHTAASLRQAMLVQGILIRDCSNYPGLDDRYIRLAVRLPADNRRLLAALQKTIAGDCR